MWLFEYKQDRYLMEWKWVMLRLGGPGVTIWYTTCEEISLPPAPYSFWHDDDAYGLVVHEERLGIWRTYTPLRAGGGVGWASRSHPNISVAFQYATKALDSGFAGIKRYHLQQRGADVAV